MNYNNPTLKLVIPDYPYGGSKRGQCTFEVHNEKKGYRVSRITFGKPKFSTYQGKSVITQGDDGKTYILEHCKMYNGISVLRHDFMNSDEGVVFQDSNPTRYNELNNLINQCYQ